MKKHFIAILLTAGSLAACGGGSGPSSEVCDFEFTAISNGASAKQAHSFWTCQDKEGSYDLAFFDDGAGALSTLGAITWQESGCGAALAQTAEGELEAEQIQGSSASGTMTFRSRNSTTGLSSDNSCFLVELESVAEIAETPPEAPPSEGEPQGGGNDEAVLPAPTQSGSVFFVFAQDWIFLGFVNDNRFDSDSLCNKFGNYGNKFSASSLWNKFGAYGGDFGALSAFNDFSSTPPILFDEVGPLAYVTTSSVLSPRVDSFYLLALLQAAGCDVER